VSTPELTAEHVVRLLTRRGLTLGVGESCTGGLVGHLLTEVPGSSACFLGTIVAYANDAKERLLGVPAETLIQHGSVSEQTVVAMARGARQRFGADIGVGVSGILGPGGGTEEKPVGLVYLAVEFSPANGAARLVTRRVVWDGNRGEKKRHSAQLALSLIVEILATPDN